jgi:DNA-binding NtrC family response regulator
MLKKKEFKELLAPFKHARLLYVEDDTFLRDAIHQYLYWYFPDTLLAENGEEALEIISTHPIDLMITDIKMPKMDGLELSEHVRTRFPDMPIILCTAFTDIPILLRAIELNIDKFVQKPMDGDLLLKAIHRCLLPRFQQQQLTNLNRSLKQSLEHQFGGGLTISRIIDDIVKVSQTTFSVILQGETGVGKTLVASTIHELSQRSQHPFVTVDIGTIPETLIERELFGHVKGAFTGAHINQPGLFAKAHKGSLFIDELENMSPFVQKKFLRVVEEKRLTPLGSTQTIDVDVRIIAASNSNLAEAAASGQFRKDLYFRLNDFTIDIPPLRDRIDELPKLCTLFVEEICKELNRPTPLVPQHLIDHLSRQPWPGNIRQLKNTLRQALLNQQGSSLLPEHLPGENQQVRSAPPQTAPIIPPPSEGEDLNLQNLEIRAIKEAVRRCKGRKNGAAQILGIDYSTLRRKISRLKISLDE